MISVRARAVRWVDDEPFPGWVEVHLDLANGTMATLFDKPSVFCPDDRLRAGSAYPVILALDCNDVTTEDHRRADPATTLVCMAHGVSDTSGRTTFLVRDQDIDRTAVK